jgi:hypothetical protein
VLLIGGVIVTLLAALAAIAIVWQQGFGGRNLPAMAALGAFGVILLGTGLAIRPYKKKN